MPRYGELDGVTEIGGELTEGGLRMTKEMRGTAHQDWRLTWHPAHADGGRMASQTEAGTASPRVSPERRTTTASLGSGGGPCGGPFRCYNLQAKLLVVQREDALRDRTDKLATPMTSSGVLAKKGGV
jgi:hypothetical protein